MTLTDYLLYDLSKSHTTRLAAKAAAEPHIIDELWDIAISDAEPENWRAAWVIKGIWEQQPQLIVPWHIQMIEMLPKLTKEGVKREFLKIISETPLPTDEVLLGVLLNTCFQWLATPAEPIAIKIHSMNILQQISHHVPEIIPELCTTIEVAMQEGSAGIVNRGSRTLQALRKQRH
ncbi:MAG: hypothetical protein EOM83_12005 [Clostridia bacterium]|nr:hypothetical protein [Clostridia bacterium]